MKKAILFKADMLLYHAIGKIYQTKSFFDKAYERLADYANKRWPIVG